MKEAYALKIRESDDGNDLVVFAEHEVGSQLHSVKKVVWSSLETALDQIGSVVSLCSEKLAAAGCESAELELGIGVKAKVGWGLGGEADATIRLKLKVLAKKK